MQLVRGIHNNQLADQLLRVLTFIDVLIVAVHLSVVKRQFK